MPLVLADIATLVKLAKLFQSWYQAKHAQNNNLMFLINSLKEKARSVFSHNLHCHSSQALQFLIQLWYQKKIIMAIECF